MFGKITSLNFDKGFGVVRPDDGSRDCVFHSDQCVSLFDLLNVHDLVSFDAAMTSAGPRASAVTMWRRGTGSPIPSRHDETAEPASFWDWTDEAIFAT